MQAAQKITRASAYGELAEVRRLLEQDPGLINALDDEGWSPLLAACNWRRWDVAELLLKLGADPHTTDSKSVTLLNLALLKGAADLAARAEAYGA